MQLSDLKNFELESLASIRHLAADIDAQRISQQWIDITGPHRYVYNWRWMGLPIIQLPADVVALQEIVFRVKPSVIVETGVARGGSTVFNASMLMLVDLFENGYASASDSKRRCVGVDIEIRRHNREAIESHPLSKIITLIEGSSTDESTVKAVEEIIRPDDTVLVILDSNHTHEHVLSELRHYAPIVTAGSYLVVHDTGIENAAKEAFVNREWGRGNNPLTALRDFLSENPNFVIDNEVCDKLLITSSPSGYLRKI
jgi:cephalosporin hydroxylase